MSKAAAHIILFIVDIAAIVGLWWCCDEIGRHIVDAANAVDSISFQSGIGFFGVGIIVPTAHIFSIFEHVKPSFVRRYSKVMNFLAVILFAMLIATAHFVSSHLQNHVEKSGYSYCQKASRSGTFSTYMVYTKNEEVCYQLTTKR